MKCASFKRLKSYNSFVSFFFFFFLSKRNQLLFFYQMHVHGIFFYIFFLICNTVEDNSWKNVTFIKERVLNLTFCFVSREQVQWPKCSFYLLKAHYKTYILIYFMKKVYRLVSLYHTKLGFLIIVFTKTDNFSEPVTAPWSILFIILF